MTCSSIVQYNFSLNPDIKLNCVDADTFLTSTKNPTSNQNNILLPNQLNDCGKVNEKERLPIKNLKPTPTFLINQKKSAKDLNSNDNNSLNESINSQDKSIKSNMNNGLSNGHDLNLDFDLNSDHLISPLNSPSSYSVSELSSNASYCVNPVSSSSSCPDQNILLNTGDTMGLLNASTQKGDLSQNFLLFKTGNKIENGQSLILDPGSHHQWANIKNNLIEKDTLPQIESSTTTTATTLSNYKATINFVNSENTVHTTNALRTDNNRISIGSGLIFPANHLIKNNNQPTNLNLGQNCDEQKQFFNKYDSNSILLIKEESCSGGLSPERFTSLSRDVSHHQPELNFSTENSLLIDDPVPKEEESICNSLLLMQQSLYKRFEGLKRRVRRLQVQYTHKNLTKQMKQFISHNQRLNAIMCQRMLDFPHLINEYSDLLSLQKEQSEFQKSINNQQSNSNNIKTILNSSNQILNSTINFQKANSSNFLFNQSNLNYLHNLPYSSDVQSNLIQQPKQSSFNNNNVTQRILSQENKNKLLKTIDSLRYNLRHLESKYDSDATDSSSGGESCDELEEIESSINNNFTSTLPSSKHQIPIRNRLSWKWCNERSAIASRWSWLQAHITDLETKLRQQNDLFRHIRATKGSINFGENDIVQRQFPSFSSINSNHSNVPTNQQQTSGSSSLSSGNNSNNSSISSINSSSNANIFLESTKEQTDDNNSKNINSNNNNRNNNNGIDNNNGNIEEENYCMRTMPFISMKRRKLLWSENNLSMAVKKAVKYSSVQCSCNIYSPHVPPCVICNGRYSYMHSIDTEFMPYYERVSLLDSSCHPTLCLPNDVPLGLHFTHFLKREAFNNNKPAITRNKKKKTIQNNPTSISNDQKPKKKLLSHLKSKKKFNKSKKRRPSSDSVKKNQRERLPSGCSSRPESPVSSPSPSEASSTCALVSTPTNPTSAPLNRRRRSEQHAFDINNIVIPYSIAATTRVERLQYKEIITPRWRLIEAYSIPPPENVKREIINNINNKNINEDVSDNAFQVRHSKCELVERQRIMTFYGNQKNQNARKGSRVRFESKSDSLDQTSQDSCSSSKIKSKAHNNECERRRHSSISKNLSSREDVLPEEQESVTPYELRKFPLLDWVYEKMVQETNIQKEEEERRSCRSTVKVSVDDDFDLLDDPDLSSSRISPPTLDDMDINDDENIKTHMYEGEVICEENDDPEWKPPKL